MGTGAELRRWYWLRSELADLARTLGVSASGGKQELTNRLAAALDGEVIPQPGTHRQKTAQLVGPLSLTTVLPAGQRCSQALRAFFVSQVGGGFTFDAHMRTFVAERAGATLGEAIDHWHCTRGALSGEIGEQFELNRFTRRWHLEHPGGDRADLRQAWADYRATPVERRGRV